jgi:hypothetical protein
VQVINNPAMNGPFSIAKAINPMFTKLDNFTSQEFWSNQNKTTTKAIAKAKTK